MGTQNGHNVPFLKSASLRKRKRKAMKRIKKYKISKKSNKKYIYIKPSGLQGVDRLPGKKLQSLFIIGPKGKNTSMYIKC